MTFTALLFLTSCVVVGLGLTGYLNVELRLEERLPVAAVVGTMAVTLASLPTIAVFGFGGAAVVVAIGIGLAVGAANRAHVATAVVAETDDFRRRFREPWTHWESPKPLLALWTLTTVLTIRILGLAYQPVAGGIGAGHLSTFGDWQAHLAYAGSFAEADGLNLDTPLAAGERLAYHFGVDLFSALGETTGMSRYDSMVVTSGFLAIAIVPILYMFGRRLFGRRAVALGGTILFLCAGGLGYIDYFDDVSAVPQGNWLSRARSVLFDQPRDYTRDFDTYYMDNPVLGHLYPQRPTLIGFSVVLIALSFLWQSRSRRTFASVGILVGLTPLFHTFGWGTALVMGAIWAGTDYYQHRSDPDERAPWGWYLVPATLLAIPAVLWLRPPNAAESFRWHFGWVTDGSLDDVVRFWWLNTGLFPILFVAALLLHKAVPTKLAVALAPIWLWFVGVNIAIPHPWPGNNAKYAIFWWMIGAFAVAALLAYAWDWAENDDKNDGIVKLVTRGGVAFVAASLVFSGGLDIVAAADGTRPGYPAAISTPGQVELGKWISVNTDDDAVFVASTSSPAASVPAALAGRQQLSAFDGWVFDLGIDWDDRRLASLAILEGAPESDSYIDQYGVDYVVIGPPELGVGADLDYWSAEGTMVYNFGGYRVFTP